MGGSEGRAQRREAVGEGVRGEVRATSGGRVSPPDKQCKCSAEANSRGI